MSDTDRNLEGKPVVLHTGPDVLPGDRQHELSQGCWCQPTVTRNPDTGDIVVEHHAV